ncbi:lmo0937 family membrane protein [Chenggangzhangella methanolivorans]|jgi:hypothetical protein|uniref:Lmo0937 family membrane protein n=1 Tax=Chenggangzhangella methanolivorans TaxID=1437009 RepID=A0A9E6R7L2_9HYPH|nr:lmo0937 family membrane protein [Chenggangzhangella methanolivorans]QZN99677.1 lmo0937 family membrane protein [Chenggangzhangella methanolivorans]
MLWAIALFLVIAWALGFVVFHVASWLIHLLLIVAVAVVILRLVRGQPAV